MKKILFLLPFLFLLIIQLSSPTGITLGCAGNDNRFLVDTGVLWQQELVECENVRDSSPYCYSSTSSRGTLRTLQPSMTAIGSPSLYYVAGECQSCSEPGTSCGTYGYAKAKDAGGSGKFSFTIEENTCCSSTSGQVKIVNAKIDDRITNIYLNDVTASSGEISKTHNFQSTPIELGAESYRGFNWISAGSNTIEIKVANEEGFCSRGQLLLEFTGCLTFRSATGAVYSGDPASWTPIEDQGQGIETGTGFPEPTAPQHSLIGKVGSWIFFVGSGFSGNSKASGTLQLGMNDDDFRDNSGSLKVTIKKSSASKTISIPATAAWTDTGVSLAAGDSFSITSEGTWDFIAGLASSNADGDIGEEELPLNLTCAQAPGFICSKKEVCEGDWLEVIDTSECCSKECTCSPQWDCSDWTACTSIAGIRTRICEDSAYCYEDKNKPIESESCRYTLTCQDNDQDGYGRNCWVNESGKIIYKQNDCNDNDAAINPLAAETCDGIDNDCDSTIDEGCACTPPGLTKECGSVEGACKQGIQTCTNGYWSLCAGNIKPIDEICNNAKDDDCDSQIDEACECAINEIQECGSDVGECQKGTRTCINGIWDVVCNTEKLPSTEICDDTLDNDCDDKIDLNDESCKVTSVSCYNKIQDANEQGIDCGGPCPTCPTCSDRRQNQDEEAIDCGGACPACPTCFDGIKNGNEQGIDCGGDCSPCTEQPAKLDSDNDDLSDEEELLRGTDPSNPDTDSDGISDGADALPLCPNKKCDAAYGETKENCPADCTKARLWLIPVIFIILIAAILIYFYPKIKTKFKISSSKEIKPAIKTLPSKITLKQKPLKQRSSQVEEKLSKSFKESEKIFKK